MDLQLLNMIVCPKCHGKLEYDKAANELRCLQDQLIYPIDDNIPVLLESAAKPIGEPSKS